MFEPGDIIVDGGNALFTDTIRREKAVRETGINFVGAGISGGEEGALNGPSIMPGGSDESWVTLGPILKSIAAIAEGEPCVTHVGHDGAGHFVKMVHNGIEYADMQLIAEAYDLIRRGTGKIARRDRRRLRRVEHGRARVATSSRSPPRCCARSTPRPASRSSTSSSTRPAPKGTGAWTVQTALDLGVPGLGHRRGRLRPLAVVEPRAARRRMRPARPVEAWTRRRADADAFVEDVRLALYASKIVAYSQGFDEIVAGAERVRLGHQEGRRSPKIWRGGCIIRARFLNRIADAYADDPGLVALLTAPVLRRGRRPARRTRGAASSSTAAQSGIPAPAFSSSLAYYDGLRADRLPAALVQGQRDFFGAHTYKRVDKEGTFHTLWSGDRTEIETTPSSHSRRPADARPEDGVTRARNPTTGSRSPTSAPSSRGSAPRWPSSRAACCCTSSRRSSTRASS